MDKVYTRIFEPEIKCGGCNFGTYSFYSHDPSDFKLDEEGRCNALCAYCFLDVVIGVQTVHEADQVSYA